MSSVMSCHEDISDFFAARKRIANRTRWMMLEDSYAEYEKVLFGLEEMGESLKDIKAVFRDMENLMRSGF